MKERATVVIVALLHCCITCEGDDLSVKLFCSYTVTAGCLDVVEIQVAIPVRKLLGRDKVGICLLIGRGLSTAKLSVCC